MVEQSRDILLFGTCGCLEKQATPVMLDIAERLPTLGLNEQSYPAQQSDFASVQISCTWSKTLSVTNVMVADLRAINQEENYSKIAQVLERLGKNWDPRDGKSFQSLQ